MRIFTSRMLTIFHLLFIATITFIGCSEGDIITDDVDFTADLENCFNENDFVFYKIDSAENRSMSLSFTSTSFDINPATAPTDTTVITLSSSNSLIYREFNSEIDGDTYFCSSIPPSDTNIVNELLATDGTAEIIYTLKDVSDPMSEIYIRTIVLKNITLIGDGVALRREFLTLGTEEIDFSS